MEFISVEEFLKQPEEIQQIFIDWWKPEIGDLVKCKSIVEYNDNELMFISRMYDDEKLVGVGHMTMRMHCKNELIPLLTEGQIRRFIEDVNAGKVDADYYFLTGYDIRVTDGFNQENIFKLSDLGENLLQAYWKSACKRALEIAEQQEILALIQEREKNDDGTRYTTEDIKRLRSQRSE